VTALTTERLTRLPPVREVWSLIPDRSNLTQRCKRFATASTYTQVGVLLGAMTRSWAPQTRYTLQRISASINESFGFILVCKLKRNTKVLLLLLTVPSIKD